MAYTIQAVIGHKAVLSGQRMPLATVELAQGYVLIPLTARVRAELKIPFCPLTDGDGTFPAELCILCAGLSAEGALAYIEAEFFGGDGTQAAAVFKNGEAQRAAFASVTSINEALADIGVQKLNHRDEFEALALGRNRDTEKWLA